MAAKTIGRLTRLEARVSRRAAQPAYDLDRLTEPQLERLVEILGRGQTGGFDGLTYPEIEDLVAMGEILRAAEPPARAPDEDWRTQRWATQPDG